MKYFFILGKNPELSMAEVVQVLGSRFEVLGFRDSVAVVESDQEFDLKKLQSRLGGTVKCGGIIGEIENARKLPDFIIEHTGDRKKESGKFHFGFSMYGTDNHKLTTDKQLHALGIEIKQRLKEQGISSRFVTSKEPSLSSVIVTKEHLLEGWDIIILSTQNGLLIGKTIAVQEFKEYSERDYGRPGRDEVSGMLPPKLAKIMINLAQVPEDGSILDPFCGSGTVLQEAALLGYKKITGSDLETQAVSDTKLNLAWLHEKLGIDTAHIAVIQCPAEEVARYVEGAEFDAIITEPYLGPALRGREPAQELLKTKRGLEKLYLDAFGQFKQILKPGGRVVMVLPVFVTGKEMMSMDIIDGVKKMGFSVVNPLTPALSLSERGSEFRWPLMYYREGQKVYREIWIFEKK